MNVSADHVKQSFLGPAMDARALNLNQNFRLANGTPECDSLFEHLRCIEVDTREERTHLELALGLVTVVSAENMSEGAIEQLICGAADTLARDLRGVELNGVSGVLKAKSIARRLRGPLALLGSPAALPSMAFVDAVREVDDVIRLVPSSQLLSAGVEHELGGARFRLLRELHGRKTA